MNQNYELLLEEYKIGKQVSDCYFRNLYSTISFTLVMYGAILVVSNKIDEKTIWCIFSLFLPIATYILGIFYTYNSLVITKHSFYFIYLEMLIKLSYYEKNRQNCKFQGWDIFAKKYGGGYILTYGTMLMFYITLPIFDFIYSYSIRNWKISINIFTISPLNSIFSILPFVIYFIYLIIIIYIIINICKIHKEMKEMEVHYKIDEKILKFRPHIDEWTKN